jgi:Spx/MgsR family transcriptional regulator
MKKARKWLGSHGVAYEFHDFKKHGVDEQRLRTWVRQAGWEVLLNRRGMMWRKVPDDVRANIDEASAIELMLSTPSIIKRPVLEHDGALRVGFSEADYEALFD